MKNYSYCFLPVILFFTNPVSASNEIAAEGSFGKCPPAYWVVRSNTSDPDSINIFVYDGDNNLIYQEELNNFRLNLRKQHTKRKLNRLVALVKKGRAATIRDGGTTLVAARLFGKARRGK